MSIKHTGRLIRKATLTDDEQRYVDARNDLRLLREQYLASGGATSEDGASADEDEADEEDDDEDTGMTVEEWVAQASKPEIVSELERRGIEHDAKSRKDDLGALLIANVEV